MKQKRSKNGRRKPRIAVAQSNSVTITYSIKNAGVKLEIIPANTRNKKEG